MWITSSIYKEWVVGIVYTKVKGGQQINESFLTTAYYLEIDGL